MNTSKRPEIDAAIRAGWTAGDSAAAIGRNLGVTKNVVIGRVHRLKLAPRGSPLCADSSSRYKRPLALVASAAPAVKKQTIAKARPVLKARPVSNSRPVQAAPPTPEPVWPDVMLEPVAEVPTSTTAMLPMSDPGRGCLFPMWPTRGDIPRPALYCGVERHGSGAVYCTAHYLISYTFRAPRTSLTVSVGD